MITPLVRSTLAVALVGLALPAQSSPCVAFNDTNTNVSNGITGSPFVGLNPNSRAYQFTVQSPQLAQSAAIFTGSPIRDDYMRLEIWDEDPNTQRPGNRLATGTMASPMSMTAHWLGTNFDFATILSPNTNYWFVWIESGASIVPEEPGGVALPRTTRATTNPWGTVGSGAAKFRIYCNLYEQNVRSVYGPSCVTSSGEAPATFANSAPTITNTDFGVEATNLPAGTTAWLLLGGDPNAAQTPLGPLFPAGCHQNTDILVAVPGTVGVAEIGDQPSTPRPLPFGYIRYSLPLNLAGGTGIFLAAQVAAIDGASTASVPLVTTNAIRFVTQ